MRYLFSGPKVFVVAQPYTTAASFLPRALACGTSRPSSSIQHSRPSVSSSTSSIEQQWHASKAGLVVVPFSSRRPAAAHCRQSAGKHTSRQPFHTTAADGHATTASLGCARTGTAARQRDSAGQSPASASQGRPPAASARAGAATPAMAQQATAAKP